MFGEEDIVKSHEKRNREVATLVLGMMGIIFARLCFLQVFKGEVLHRYSIENRLREEVLWAPRGKFYSRNMQLLVDNKPRFDATLTRQYLKNERETLAKVAEILGMTIDDIDNVIRRNAYEAKYRPITIKKNISRVELARIETENDELPGINVQVSIAREYIDKEIGAHLLGYISEIQQDQLPRYRKRDNVNYRLGDFIGQSGLEQQLDNYIRGTNGQEYVEVDALGRKRKYINTDNLFTGVENIKPVPGNSLILTIDRDLQKIAHDALQDKAGSLVAIDIKTGEVLAMVSNPAYLPSEFSKGLDPEYWQSLVGNPDRPLRDRVIQEHYSPGSTFKVVTALTGLAEGVINNQTEFFCSGAMNFGRRAYHCWKKGGHGRVNLDKAIRESCNIFFQKVSLKLDIDSIAHYARMLGFGKKTGINIPREISGLIPTKDWKQKTQGVEWQKGETLSCAIGQSFILVTTIQLALAYSAVANNGKVYKPYVVKEIIDKDGEILKTFSSELISELKLPDEYFDKVKRGLFQVVNHPHGTARWLRDSGLLLAGKTGTSQVIRQKAEKIYQKCELMPYEHRHHGVFAGFAPANNPRIALASIVEHGCHGSTAAAPVVQKVALAYMKKYHQEEYEENKKNYKKILKEFKIEI
ncbi:MAG: penicillin-binding protein 2 [Halobacteriovoraceae bacterium]|nr:penicillin-binding protein 2 [Halobacteriovoraceae bacterium]